MMNRLLTKESCKSLPGALKRWSIGVLGMDCWINGLLLSWKSLLCKALQNSASRFDGLCRKYQDIERLIRALTTPKFAVGEVRGCLKSPKKVSLRALSSEAIPNFETKSRNCFGTKRLLLRNGPLQVIDLQLYQPTHPAASLQKPQGRSDPLKRVLRELKSVRLVIAGSFFPAKPRLWWTRLARTKKDFSTVSSGSLSEP